MGLTIHYKLTFANGETAQKVLKELHEGAESMVEAGLVDGISPIKDGYFTVDIGEGCEYMGLGMSTPEKQKVVFDTLQSDWCKTEPNIYINFCKTGHAYNEGVEQFVRCHVAVCMILKQAELCDGVEVDVRDEAEFWDCWNLVKLL